MQHVEFAWLRLVSFGFAWFGLACLGRKQGLDGNFSIGSSLVDYLCNRAQLIKSMINLSVLFGGLAL